MGRIKRLRATNCTIIALMQIPAMLGAHAEPLWRAAHIQIATEQHHGGQSKQTNGEHQYGGNNARLAFYLLALADDFRVLVSSGGQDCALVKKVIVFLGARAQLALLQPLKQSPDNNNKSMLVSSARP